MHVDDDEDFTARKQHALWLKSSPPPELDGDSSDSVEVLEVNSNSFIEFKEVDMS